MLLTRWIMSLVADVPDPTVDLAFVGLGDLLDRVALRDVHRVGPDRFGQPQPVWLLVAARKSGPVHQHRDGVMADPAPASKNELGVDSISAVALIRGRMDLTDHIGQPGMTDAPRRREP